MQIGNAGRLADYCKLDMRVLLAVPTTEAHLSISMYL